MKTGMKIKILNKVPGSYLKVGETYSVTVLPREVFFTGPSGMTSVPRQIVNMFTNLFEVVS
jgi:hypothetical protein